MSDAPALELVGIAHTFHQGGADINVLRGIDLTVAPGEIVAILGPSGSGKSTLLHIAGLLDTPDRGEVRIEGFPCSTMDDRGRTSTRRTKLGFVYQFHHLLPEFSALENIAVPQRVAGVSKAKANERAMDLLGRMGLADRATHRPAQLSGGEQQRVAVARALANSPAVLLADEPTGNLDEGTSERVFNELLELVRARGLAALIATHNTALAKRMDRIASLHKGKLTLVET
jgi:lipoprotein-releasing system ATP-binding protein